MFLKTIAAYLVFFSIALNILHAKEDDVFSIKEELIRAFEKNFEIIKSENWIILTSKKQVKFYNNLNAPYPLSEEIIKNAKNQKYIIRLFFDTDKLAPNYYKKIKALELEINSEIEKKAKGKSLYSESVCFLKPTYYDKHYSIYLYKTSYNSEKILDEKDEKMIEDVFAFLDKKFSKYDQEEDVKEEKQEKDKAENNEEKK